MGNRKVRELMLQKQHEADWERVRTEQRSAYRDVFARGIGLLRIQLIECPSFGEGQAWEVRDGPEGWLLYHPRVVSSWPEVQLVGYDKVEFSSDRLESFFGRIVELTLPIAPDLSNCAGCDGTSYQLAVFGGLFSSWRFKWWSTPPENWRPLIDIAAEMLGAFSAAAK
jgi:hypothetical protein